MTPEPNQKIKVLHLIARFDIGGAEQLLLTLARNFQDERFELIFGCIDAEGELAEELAKTGAELICFKEKRFRHSYRKYLNLYRFIRNNKIDIVHTHLHRANYLGRLIAYLAGVPLIIKSEHGFAGDYRGQEFIKRPPYVPANKLLDKITDAFVYVSKFQYDQNIGVNPSQKMHVVPNALDEGRFNRAKSKKEMREILKIAEEEKVIGIVANLISYKGHKYLLQALKEVVSVRPDVKLVLAGEGAEEAGLRKLTADLGLDEKVIFLGKRFDVPDLLSAMDIYVQPSLFESFGLSIAEAMFAGLPVIASRAGGIPEIIADGENGLLVEKANSSAIAAAILSLLENPGRAQALVEKGRESVCHKFVGKVYARNILQLYQKLAAQNSSRIKDAIAYILDSFPGGNPPFIINEIIGLQQEGVNIVVFPIHKMLDGRNKQNSLSIPAIHLEPFSPKIIFSHLYYLFSRPSLYLHLMRKYREYGGKKVFWEGIYFARLMEGMKIKHIHAHFAWKAADCARLINNLTGISYSLTAHQSDIHRCPERLEEKVKEAKFVLTCTNGNNEYLARKYGSDVAKKTFTVYHGVDTNKFYPPLKDSATKDIDVLSMGNLIKVKGFGYLIQAIGLIKESVAKCVIIGRGEEKDNLSVLIKELGLDNKIEIIDPVPHDEVARFFNRAKVFSLPVTTIDNSPHGIPNVIAEAMAMGLPVVVSNVPHIPELIESEENGLLVTDKDPEGMAGAIGRFLTDGELRLRLGRNAREKIMRDFDSKKHVRKIADLFIQVV